MLLLLPNILYEEGWGDLPQNLRDKVASLDMLVAESEKVARQYLRHFGQTLPIDVFNRHSSQQDIDFFLRQMQEGKVLGLISDAGLVAVADPGSALVEACHKAKLPVKGLGGPSSITLGLMLSGFSANRFSFYGYLPKSDPEKKKKLLLLESRSEEEGSAEIFIETPYRAKALFLFLLDTLQRDTLLFVGKELGSANEYAYSQRVASWKKSLISWGKDRAIFILYRGHFFLAKSRQNLIRRRNRR
ncbi:MAG: SAM-dependent methyltransferase [Chlamydiota bacterium]